MASVWDLVSAELAGALLMLLFAWNITKSVQRVLEMKHSEHCDGAAYPLF